MPYPQDSMDSSDPFVLEPRAVGDPHKEEGELWL